MHRSVITRQNEAIAAMRATSGVNATEGKFLAWLAQTYVARIAVEIGSCEGRSACYILDALSDKSIDAKLHCVDLWELGGGETPAKHSDPKVYNRFRKNILRLGLGKRVIPHKARSSDMARGWKEPIDLLFIDGSHVYKDVAEDWELWSPFVRIGGVVAFHDANQEDVGRVIADIPTWRWLAIPTDQSDRISAFIRVV